MIGKINEHESSEEDEDSLKIQQSRLWDDHFYLNKQVIVALTYKLVCLETDINSLYTNVGTIGDNFIELIDSERAGKKLKKALTEHVKIELDIINDLILGNNIDQLTKLWIANAREISHIYNKYNPCIKFKIINKLLHQLVKSTLDEIISIIKSDCAKSVETSAIALQHTRSISDYINTKFPCQECTSDSS